MSTLGKLAWLKAVVETRRFRAAIADVERAQARVLADLLRRNRDSGYGRRFGFGSIGSPREYAARVPVVEYAELAADVERAVRQPRVLSADPVTQWVYSSGTSGGPKLLPHTARSIRDWCVGYARAVYGHAMSLAIADRLFSGKIIYDVAPARVDELAGIPAGYISGVAANRNQALRGFQCVPQSITALPRHEEKLAALLRWSLDKNITAAGGITSFIYRLLRYIQENALALAEEPALAARLAAASAGDGRVDLHRLWPHFGLIVSTGVSIDLYRPLLAQVAPHATVCDVYSASEAAYGFGVPGAEGVVLNADLYYLELAEPERPEAAVPLHHGTPGGSYELVLTAANGLWRYRSGDVVQLLALDPPRVRVLGRSGNAVNLSGEKVVERQVTEALLAVARQTGVSCSGYFFFGWIASDATEYVLALEPDRPIESLERFAETFARALERENELFRLLRQRARTEVQLVELKRGSFDAALGKAETARGAAGHVKLKRLVTLPQFCGLVPPERIARQTLQPGVHEIQRLGAGEAVPAGTG